MTHPAYPMAALNLLRFFEQLYRQYCKPKPTLGFFDVTKNKKNTSEPIELENIIDL